MPQAPHALEGQKTFLKQTSEVPRRTRRKNRQKDTVGDGRTARKFFEESG